MPLRPVFARFVPIAAAVVLGATLTACAGTGLTETRIQGYVIPESAVQQIRPGASRDLVQIVLGSPQTTNTFGNETAWYYVETRVQRTAFGLTTVQERTVLAVYFDANNRVRDRAIYTLQDGRVFNIETQRTDSFGQDRNFIQSILASI